MGGGIPGGCVLRERRAWRGSRCRASSCWEINDFVLPVPVEGLLRGLSRSFGTEATDSWPKKLLEAVKVRDTRRTAPSSFVFTTL